MQKENKGPNKVGLTALLGILIAFFVGTMIYVAVNANTKQGGQIPLDTQPNGSIAAGTVPDEDSSNLCVIKAVDTDKLKMTLFDTIRNETVELTYTGGTDIRNKYDKPIAAAQLELGEMVDASYSYISGKVKSLKESTDCWESTGVTDFVIDRNDKIIKLDGVKYKYTSELYCRNADEDIALLSINTGDELTVRGMGKTIYSIVVTRGHGTVRLVDAEYFEGGYVSIGSRDFSNISEDMIFTVPEGKTKLTITKGNTSGTKNITVTRDSETIVNVSEFTPEPVKTGEVTFEITPFGAPLMVDGKETSYANPVTLDYGEHSILVSIDGYETYKGTYTLKKASDTVKIELPKSEVQSSDSSNNSTSGTTGSTGTTGTNGTTGSTGTTGTTTVTPIVTVTPGATTTPGATGTVTATPTPTTSAQVDSSHTIYIKQPAGASVYINGTYKGIAPVKIEKPLGLTYITLMKEGYQQITHSVTIEDDKEDKTYTFANLLAETN